MQGRLGLHQRDDSDDQRLEQDISHVKDPQDMQEVQDIKWKQAECEDHDETSSLLLIQWH
jgi:hypothetical protein